MRFEDRRSLFV